MQCRYQGARTMGARERGVCDAGNEGGGERAMWVPGVGSVHCRYPGGGNMHATSPVWFSSFGEGLDLSLAGDAPGQAGQSCDRNQKSETVRYALVFHREVCSGTGPS